ncbi:30S ribosomal protein S4 [Patescibacteria group bacterium]|nr:30S ribosomal protein S4 [Patescibacteria group bacterium]MBU1890880.1 30S ribosomal protein S4 [Patescibacteria group bacterium]
MGRSLDPKCKQCRREGEKLFLKGEKCSTTKCSIIKRNYPPGAQGASRHGRMSNYGVQLREKQKARRIYGLRETQFYNYYIKALKMKGETGENLHLLLERRLDNVIFRLGMGESRNQARQIVSHGHFTVNGRSVNIPSYQVKVGEEIKVKKGRLEKSYFKDLVKRIEKHDTPSWLELNKKDIVGKVTGAPTQEELVQNFKPQLIIEFYSR